MYFDCLDIEKIVGFDWDDGNIYKNKAKHKVKWTSVEEIFFNEPLLIVEDFKHSQDECRCLALGVDDDGKKLSVVFTIREQKIRVISARPMSKKRGVLIKKLKEIPTFKTEEEERLFWEEHDAGDYFDLEQARKVRFPNLKKTTKSISIRLPVDMLEELKVKANAIDVPYQSYIKMILKKELEIS